MSSHFFYQCYTKMQQLCNQEKLLLWISFNFEIGIWKVKEKGGTIEFLRNMGLTLKYLFKQKLSLIAMSISQHACRKINIEIQNLISGKRINRLCNPASHTMQKIFPLQFCQQVTSLLTQNVCLRIHCFVIFVGELCQLHCPYNIAHQINFCFLITQVVSNYYSIFNPSTIFTSCLYLPLHGFS